MSLCDGLKMARQLRVEFPGAIYHVTCRMIGDRRLDRSRLFKSDADRKRFLDRLGDRVEQYNIRLYLFVLMTNHFHLVFETPEGNCSKFMQSLSTAYTVYYNLRHGRHGHLLDGRFKGKLVDGDDYLLALTRYVHVNPVEVGPMKRQSIKEQLEYLRSYPWSTYQSYIGKAKAFSFVDYGPMLAEMGGKRSQWPKRYQEFVERSLTQDDPSSPNYDETCEEFRSALKKSPRSIGSDGFRARIDELYQQLIEGHNSPEDISFRHITEPLAVETIMATLTERLDVDEAAFRQRRRHSPLRPIAARMLIRFGGQTQRQVAVHLGMSTGGAVSAQVRKLSGLLDEDRRLARKVKLIERNLEAQRREK